MIKIKWSCLALATTVLLSSCKDDDNGSETSSTANYVMSLRAQDANDESADYLLTLEDVMSGDISAEGQGEELVGWNYTSHFGDSYFAFGYDLNECVGYKVVDNTLQYQGKFVFERMDVIDPIDDESFIAIGAPWGGGSYDCQLQVVDIEEIAIHKNVKHPIYESFDADGVQMNAWPTSTFVDGDKLYVSFYPLNGVSWETPNTDTAYVSIYSYPELEYISTIKDARSGPIGYYGAQPCLLTDEAGDHYTLSSGAKSTGFTQATKPSGILRIKSGETAFDDDYFFDLSSTGYKVTSGVYVGNGKVVARVISDAMDETAAAVNQWAAFSETTAILNVAVIDLIAKTLTIVDDVPLHGGQYKTPFLVEDGKVYVSVNDGTEAYIYRVDPVAATAEKGAKLIGNQFQGLYSVN